MTKESLSGDVEGRPVAVWRFMAEVESDSEEMQDGEWQRGTAVRRDTEGRLVWKCHEVRGQSGSRAGAASRDDDDSSYGSGDDGAAATSAVVPA